MNEAAADELQLHFPARSGYLGISRLTATAMAASAGFDVEELDDIRLAVDEAVAWLLADELDGEVRVELTCRAGEFGFRATLLGPEAPEQRPNDLVHAILGATTDRFDTGLDGQRNRFVEMVKRRADGDG